MLSVDGTKVKLQIWDTAGLSTHKSNIKFYKRKIKLIYLGHYRPGKIPERDSRLLSWRTRYGNCVSVTTGRLIFFNSFSFLQRCVRCSFIPSLRRGESEELQQHARLAGGNQWICTSRRYCHAARYNTFQHYFKWIELNIFWNSFCR